MFNGSNDTYNINYNNNTCDDTYHDDNNNTCDDTYNDNINNTTNDTYKMRNDTSDNT